MTKIDHRCEGCCEETQKCYKCGDTIEAGFPHRGLSDKGECTTDKEDF